MKQYIFQFFCFFFILFNSSVIAGTTTLTTYYPPPTAAYNKINLSIANNPSPQTSAFCTSTNSPPALTPGATYVNSSGIVYQCTGIGASSPLNGTIHGDPSGTGTLHVVMNGKDIVYPPECYNTFCSYNPTVSPYKDSIGGYSCLGYTNTTSSVAPNPSCRPGFNATPVNGSSAYYDTFITSPQNTVISIVCCTTGVTSFISTANPGSTSWPPDETTSTPPDTTTTPP